MGILVQDVRHGIRVLSQSPGLSLVMILTLALGIGATRTFAPGGPRARTLSPRCGRSEGGRPADLPVFRI